MSDIRPAMFVDGENLVLRYQALVDAGRRPDGRVVHRPDVYVWHPAMAHHFNNGFRRVNYYASVVGADQLVSEVRSEIASQGYLFNPGVSGPEMAQIVPFVYKKGRRREKTRNVDIQIVIDVMRAAAADSYDLLFLASGDGDYLPPHCGGHAHRQAGIRGRFLIRPQSRHTKCCRQVCEPGRTLLPARGCDSLTPPTTRLPIGFAFRPPLMSLDLIPDR